MRKKEPRPIWMFIAALSVFGVLAYVTNSFPPTSNALVGLVFFLLATSCTLLFTFLLNDAKRGVLLGGGILAFLLLRLLGLRSPLYLVLLLVVLASLELTWKKR